MRNFFYGRLAWDSLRKNMQIYIPYLLTCIGCTSMYYIMTALSMNGSLDGMKGGRTMTELLSFGSQVIAIFTVIFLFYTNSFLMKRRKKELGLYSVLGMEKKHLFRLMLWETLDIAVIATVVGLAFGVLLNKAAFLLVLKIMHFDVVFGFEISVAAMGKTVVLVAVIYLLTLLNNIRQIGMSNPVELLRGGSVGEREPKTRWLMAILGIMLIGVGYYISITTTNPLAAIYQFFLAVLAVIVGTYFLFIAASIALLKLLRRNKAYYYKTNHFISISGMIYRMKQNAVGLASICILCTMVLVTVSSTLSLYLGFDDIIDTRYPYQFELSWAEGDNDFSDEELKHYVRQIAAEQDAEVTRDQMYSLATFTTKLTKDSFEVNYDAMDNFSTIYLLSAQDFPKTANMAGNMKDDDVLIYSTGGANPYPYNAVNLFGTKYRIARCLDSVDELPGSVNIGPTYYIFARDTAAMKRIIKDYGVEGMNLIKKYIWDTDADADTQQVIWDNMFDDLEKFPPSNGESFHGTVDCRTENEIYFFSTYGGLFFIGIFLGLIFLMGAVLIVYYKQVTEGYDDRQRFDIMQKVGLTKKEIKTSIRSQVLTVFFLPLVTACVHMAAAFPIVSRLLKLLNLTNTQLFVYGLLGTVVVFAVVYIVVYVITSRTYYKIVSE